MQSEGPPVRSTERTPAPADVVDAAAQVADALDRLAADLGIDAETRIAVRPIDESLVRLLFESERLLVARAVVRRRAEFATGRAMLRELLQIDRAIGRTSVGAADLPTGTCASLAHDREIAVVASTSDASIAAIGVDVEPLQDLDPAMVRMIRRSDDELDDPLAVFVAKEAAYKSWSEPGRRILEFHDVRLRRCDDATIEAEVADDGTTITVAVATAGRRWVGLATRPAT